MLSRKETGQSFYLSIQSIICDGMIVNFAASLGTETTDGAPTTYSTKAKYEYLKPSIKVSHDRFLP